MIKKINVADWLSRDDIDVIELLKNVAGITEVPEQLLSFDGAFVYDDTTKYGLGVEVAESMGAMDEKNYYSKYFDYEKLADDLLNDNKSGYCTIEDNSRYLYLDYSDPCNTVDEILLGKIKLGSANGQFLKLDKHEWVCGRYWSYGNISNSCISCGLDKYYDKAVNEVFEHTWMTAEVWDKFRCGMAECEEVLGNKTDADKLCKKLDALWDYLMGEYQKVELILEEE